MTTLGSWKNAPLAYVAAEVRLASLLNLEPFAASLQDALGAHFPRLVRAQTIGFALDAQGLRPQTSPRFHFLTADASACVVLTGETLGLHVTRYADSTTFRALLGDVLAALATVRAHIYVERMGVRYWDIVQAEGDMQVPEFFAAPVSQMLAPLPDATLMRDVHELVYEVGGTTPHIAVARLSLTAPVQQPEPPNLVAVQELIPSARLQSIRELALQNSAAKVGYVDIDASIEIKEGLDVARLIAVTKTLQATQSALFQQLTSPAGQAYWKKGNPS